MARYYVSCEEKDDGRSASAQDDDEAERKRDRKECLI